MNGLHFEPLISPALWLLLAMPAAALLMWYARHRPPRMARWRWGGIVTLMSAGIVGVLLILLNPTWVEPIPPPKGNPRLTVLVDRSCSMATADAREGESRYAQAAAMTRSLTKRLSKQFDVQVRTFDTSLAPAEPDELTKRDPDGRMTNLATVLASSLDQERPQGQALVLLSDGIHNGTADVRDVLKASKLAQAMSTPVYTKTLGGEFGVRDLALELATPQQLAYVGQKVPITVRVKHRGMPGGQASVGLWHEGREIDRQPITLSVAGPNEIRFYVSKTGNGLYHYEAKVDPLPGEVTQANNVATYQINVVDAPIRVLLLEGKPYWDGKFLIRTLASEPSVALDSIIRLSDERFMHRTLGRAEASQSTQQKNTVADGTVSAESRVERWRILSDAKQILSDRDALRSYQIIMLGRDVGFFLTDAAVAHLRDWISQDGGSLLCYRGSPMAQINERLARLFPVHWKPTHEFRFHVKLTEQGRQLRWFAHVGQDEESPLLAQLPTLATVASASEPKPLAVVWATSATPAGGEEKPVLSYQPYGTGRVVAIEGAGMWRWAFLPPQQQQYDDVYSAFWHSLVRWLVSGQGLLPGQQLDLRADRLRFTTNESASATLLVREESTLGPATIVELTGGSLDRVERFVPFPVGEDPGIFRLMFGRLSEGCYEARVVGMRADNQEASPVATMMFEVHSPLAEQLELKARPDLMARIATDSGGEVLEDATAGEIVKMFRSYVARTQPQPVRRTLAWDRWWALVGLLVVWGSAWALRRSGGLI